MRQEDKTALQEGQACLGIELGSTRIKAVLIGPDHRPLASGEYGWENRYENGVWTYPLEEVWSGLQAAYAALREQVQAEYGVTLRRVKAMGFSAMMHGYLPFDEEGRLLTPFRTWRNTITGPAAEELSGLFSFNIPQRWSIAHLYQAILNEEEHVKDISFLTTLAGYVHWMLTGEKVLGVGEASGMFPIDSETGDYNAAMMAQFDELIASRNYPWKLRNILPGVLPAGASAGVLTEEGARRLDPSGELTAGIPVCPPEGDAGTGMAATNSVAVRTGNVSAGTSVFSMVVLEKLPARVHPEIDLVTTPTGRPVAMVHCNNCTNEINAWASVLKGFLTSLGQTPDMNQIYTSIFTTALEGEADAGGLLLYNYLSGEPVTGLAEGRPLLVRAPEGRLTYPNLMRAQLYAALATLKIGNDILAEEQVRIDRMFGHGGFFKTPVAGQRILAAALRAPVSVMETAGEGGPWGMALLAAYMVNRAEGESLEEYLETQVFAGAHCETVEPEAEDVKGFDAFLTRYRKGLAVEQAAVKYI
ncbi:MAG: FGGY-family carbohydrate kinase [Lachnospiraceae bacterium]|nr:FGGY-family carbohydrate kinase [Lachnospiraceae bacterium]